MVYCFIQNTSGMVGIYYNRKWNKIPIFMPKEQLSFAEDEMDMIVSLLILVESKHVLYAILPASM